MSLPAGVAEAVGAEVDDASRVGGGSINDAWAVRLADGRRAFVKTRADAAPGEFAFEAGALAWLAEPGAVRVPAVLGTGDAFLALEWIETGSLDAAGQEALGRGLAGLHGAGAPAFGAFEADRTTLRIGRLSFDVTREDTWPGFYAQRFLLPLLDEARLTHAGTRAVERVCERIQELAGPPEPPARLHGDLWSGNVLAGADGGPWLIDPAAYGGHREVDLAMLRLFGAPSPRVLAAYEEVAPLADGHADRVELYQLFPLLVHAALFGGGYRGSAEAVARRYAG